MPSPSLRHRRTRHPLALALLAALPFTAAAAVPAEYPGADAPARNAATELDAVTVVAPGTTRQVQRITRQDIERLAPGSSPLKAIDKLPGVQFQASDAAGAYEWSTAVYLHGFDQSRLGFTLDGVPLGNMNYRVTNGLSITRAISSENLSMVELAQGGGALGTASNSNLGGTLQFLSDDPQSTPGVRFSQGFGSDSAHRTFIRADTGDLHGFSAYASYADSDTDKWKGGGSQEYQQANLKAVYAWGEGNRVQLFVDSSRRKEQDYMDLSLASQRALGWDWDYLMPDWESALQMAKAYRSSGSNGGAGKGYPEELNKLPADYNWLDSSYYWGAGIRNDTLASLGTTLNFGAATLDATGYYHGNRGEGQWVTPYVSSSNGLPLSMRTSDYGLDRYGLTASLKLEVGRHQLEVGLWGENNKNTSSRNYFDLDGKFDSIYRFFDDGRTPFRRDYVQQYDTWTRMVYAQDTLHFLADDRLTVNFGAKALQVVTRAHSLAPSSVYAAGSVEAKDNFLPQAGINYALDRHQDLYASYSENIAAYGISPFSASQATFDASKDTLKPESSRTVQFGYRAHGDRYEASVGAFYTRFSDRLLTITPCSAVQTCSSLLANVGAVDSHGLDLALVWKPAQGLNWLNTLSWNSAKYKDDYFSGKVVETSGKRVVGLPEWMFSSAVEYRVQGLRLSLDGKYTGKRYITYLNDSQVPSYWLFNAAIGYDLGRVGPVANLGLVLNATNLFDKHYFATTGTNGYVASDPEGYNQTLMAGAPRQYMISLEGSF